MRGLSDASVLISGAAAGIGRAVSLAFVECGSRVSLVDIDGPALDLLARELDAPDRIATTVADVTAAEGARQVVDDTVTRFGGLQVLVNVVGGSQPGADVIDLSEAQWNSTIAFNLTSTFLMCHFSIPHLRQNAKGSVVNISSGSGLRGMRKNPAYCAAKAGIVGLTKAMALDHGDEGIRVNAVAPGPILTPLMQRLRTAEEIDAFGSLTILGRVATAEEVARVVLFLASDEASFMTGQTLEVDGGVRGGF